MAEWQNIRWIRVGWQGFTFMLPEDWNIGAIGGDRNEGYLRFEDGDMPRLEIKWADAGTSFVDLNRVIDKYLRDMAKDKKSRVEVSRDVQLVSKRKLRGKKSGQFFAWKGETQGFGAAWFCPACNKTVIMQVLGRLNEPVQEIAEQIITQVEDHPAGEWILWSAYGFDFYSPKEFKLAGQKLMAGLIEITLQAYGEQLQAARWGMANVILRRHSLAEWSQRELAKRFKRFTVECTETHFKEHEALRIEGRTALPQEKIKSFIEHVRGKPYADRLLAILWHCPASNKLFYVEGIVDREHRELIFEVAQRIECHKDNTAP